MNGAWRIPRYFKHSETWYKGAGSKFLLVRCSRADKEPTNVPRREKGLNEQFWGVSVHKANEFYWLLRKSFV